MTIISLTFSIIVTIHKCTNETMSIVAVYFRFVACLSKICSYKSLT